MSVSPHERLGAVGETARFDEVEELEGFVGQFGFQEGKPKLIRSAACYGVEDIEDPRWEIYEPTMTTSSIASLLEVAGQINAENRSEPELLGINISLQNGYMLQIVYARGAEHRYSVVVSPEPPDL